MMTDYDDDNDGNNKNDAAYEEAMDDVHTRFILNLPDEELRSAPRIFFQLEQAWWFYDDFICDGADAAAAADENGNAGRKEGTKNKNGGKEKGGGGQRPVSLPRFKHVRPFALAMFRLSPLLSPMMPQFDEMYDEFSEYKRSISTYGTILLNADATRLVLCRTWKGKSWTLPGGKVNQNESGRDAAARETYEETGFDPMCERGICAFLRRGDGGDGAGGGDFPSSSSSSSTATSTHDDRNHDGVDASSSPPRKTWGPLQDADKLRYTESDTNKRRTAYVCRGVPEDFPFEPVARKEVSEVAWHDLASLPRQTFAVAPFVGQLKRWIREDNHRRRGIVVVGDEGGGDAGERGSGSVSRGAPSRRRAGGTPSRGRRDGQRGGRPRDDEATGGGGGDGGASDDFGFTPFFSDDGGTPWDEAADAATGGTATDEGVGGGGGGGGGGHEVPTDAGDERRDGSRGKRSRRGGGSRSGSRAASRGGSAAGGREVSATDPLVLSALASPGESDRWTEDEMFATNEQLLGRKITYDGNPHDFAEKGFDGFSGEGRVDPHSFRVVGGTFMNSTEGGMLSAPPEVSRLQPLVNSRRRTLSDVSGLSVDAGVDCNAHGMGLTPFFTDDGRAPWEETHSTGSEMATKHVSQPSVSSATFPGQSNSKGLALLNRLRQGGSADQEVERIVSPSSTPDQGRTYAENDDNSETKNAAEIMSSEKALAGSFATLDDLFMTDREITARSQMEKLAIFPPSIPRKSPVATLSEPSHATPTQPPKEQQVDDSDTHQQIDHMAWMQRWAQDLPQSRPANVFGDFRLDIHAIMNAMSTAT